jgi:hypothetical protein
MDTSISYTDRDYAYFSSDEAKWVRKIHALKAEHPDQVSIEHEPEQNDGCICAKIPVEWIKIQPKRVSTMTDEQRAMAAERLKIARKNYTK